MTFRAYADLVHRELTAALRDVVAERPDDRTVTWRRGPARVTLTDEGADWWLRYARVDAPHRHARVYDARHTLESARVIVATAATFLD